MEYTIPKGVFDILPQEPDPADIWRNSDHWHYIESIIHELTRVYGYKEIRTPLFERTELFVRTVGESSDIVTKEMYTFEDKGGRSLTLRPEGTASVMRAVAEKQLYNQAGPLKFYYIGPMFRYERPQAGRYRQHHQFGAEAIGVAKPEQDAEVIDLLLELYRRLGIKSLKVMINSVGDPACRTPYKEALMQYLQPRFDQLSPESQARFSKNVLRILDSKDPRDQALLKGAPMLIQMLNQEAKDHFEELCKLLKLLDIDYEINPKLVRGLDYYNRTVFEITAGELGAQSSIVGGGRYDGLLQELGGPNLPAVGFATGMERILQTMTGQNISFPPPPHPFLYIIGIGDESRHFCFELMAQLRRLGIPTEMELQGKKVGQGLQIASAVGAKYCLVLGEDELKTKEVKLKEMQTRKTLDVSLDSIVSSVEELWKALGDNLHKD